MRRLLPWAFVVVLLGGVDVAFLTLRPLARLADQRDPIVLLEHPTGDLAAALSRASVVTWAQLALALLPVLVLGVGVYRRRSEIAWRGPLALLVIGGLGTWLSHALIDTRVAMRTLCWAAKSGVYDRSTRERALDRGRVLLDRPLGRMAEALGAQARPQCDEAAQILGR